MKIQIGKCSADMADECGIFDVVEMMTNLLVAEGYPANFIRDAYVNEAERIEDVYVICEDKDDTA